MSMNCITCALAFHPKRYPNLSTCNQSSTEVTKLPLDHKALGTMVTAFAKAAQPEEAYRWMVKMNPPDLEAYNTVAHGFARKGQVGVGFDVESWWVMGNRLIWVWFASWFLTYLSMCVCVVVVLFMPFVLFVDFVFNSLFVYSLMQVCIYLCIYSYIYIYSFFVHCNLNLFI